MTEMARLKMLQVLSSSKSLKKFNIFEKNKKILINIPKRYSLFFKYMILYKKTDKYIKCSYI